MASLLGVGFVLNLAGRDSGPSRVVFIGVAVLTVVVSWTVVNTVYALRHADLHYRSRAMSIAFGNAASPERHTVLGHGFVSYLFGVVIVGGSVNLIAGLIR